MKGLLTKRHFRDLLAACEIVSRFWLAQWSLVMLHVIIHVCEFTYMYMSRKQVHSMQCHRFALCATQNWVVQSES